METSTTSSPPDEAKSSSDAPSPEAIARGYELTHISIRALVFVLLGLILVCTSIGISVWSLQGSLLRSAGLENPPTSMIRPGARKNNFPPLQPGGPSHDTTPAQDLVGLRASEDAVFTRIGWQKQDDGSVVVPTDVLQNLAARVAPTTRPAGGGPQ